MKKSKAKPKNVAVIFGGEGFEHDISVLGAKFVLKNIDRRKFKPLSVFIDKNGEWFLKKKNSSLSVSLTKKRGVSGILLKRKFIRLDAAFPLLHGDFGEDGKIQGLLETLKIPFVGCDTYSSAVCSDKGYTKHVAEGLGIPTVPWLYYDGGDTQELVSLAEAVLGYPIFIKPARLGSSIGSGIARSREELYDLLHLACEVGKERVLAERCLNSPRELECAFLEFQGKVYFTPPGEVRCDGGFYDYSEKYGENSRATVLSKADLDPQISEEIIAHSAMLAKRLGLRGISRIDFFLSEGKLYFNEINTVPGMTEASLYPTLIGGLGIGAFELINGLIDDAVGGNP